ncbi:Ribosomal RNA-processing protein 7-like protein A [Bienertia sinuspersici]
MTKHWKRSVTAPQTVEEFSVLVTFYEWVVRDRGLEKMGAVSSKIEDDKALQLCRERKKFLQQALDGRCALAAAHVAYIIL